MRIIDVPKSFQPDFDGKPYPQHQTTPLIEKRFLDHFETYGSSIDSDYIYIPMLWTSYHVNNNYGERANILQNFIDSIVSKYPNEKFFTVVQYAGGTLTSIPNSKIFSCSGISYCFNHGNGSYTNGVHDKHPSCQYIPIPLKCDDHSYPRRRDRFKVGFIGKLITHPCRFELYKHLRNLPGYAIYSSDNTPYPAQMFKALTANSIFTLAPRGYGPTSFRLYEALQMGSIPIYIGDDYWLPFSNELDWKKISVLIKQDQIINIPAIVDDLIASEEYLAIRKRISFLYDAYFSWEGIINFIINNISISK